MKINRTGITRIVFIFRYFVIKIPNFIYSHHHFLQGCYANWSERRTTKLFKKIEDKQFYNKISPSLYCSWFGLIQIQVKCQPLLRDLTSKEVEEYYDLCGTDNKKENFGIYKERIVCLDYV